MKLINIALYVFYIGIIFDLITTIYGLQLGFKEGNPLGATFVISIGVVIIVSMSFIIRDIIKKAKENNVTYYFLSIPLLLVGLFRFTIAIYNVYLIIGGK